MPLLSDLLEARFPRAIREDGLTDLVQGRPRIERIFGTVATGRVRAVPRDASVRVAIGRGGALKIDCSCEGYRVAGHCRHLWAFVLALETAAIGKGGVSQGMASGARKFLDHLRPPSPRVEEPSAPPPPVEPVGRPSPRLSVRMPPPGESRTELLLGRVSFDYPAATRADPEAERAALERLWSLGALPFEKNPASRRGQIPAGRFLALAGLLLAEGWTIESQGKPIARPDDIRIEVRSGNDWFDLKGGAVYGGATVAFPELLKAARKGERLIELPDGSLGLLPEEWFDRARALLSLAKGKGDSLRFEWCQGWLLDALLSSAPRADLDARFAEHRRRLAEFGGVQPVREPPGFRGELRPYQRAGLGWLLFLREFGLGGCLADDMGLGKTVQLLALLETVRASGTLAGPFLVVAPRSVVFNWIDEARKFCPALEVLEWSGADRKRESDRFEASHLVVTTYGVLRRDAEDLRARRIDTVVLDEAQAVKNAATQTAKAARLLAPGHRLALSGTPIENRLADLWSLFEFLNPGLLGRSETFQELVGSGDGLGLTPAGRESLVGAVRPFLLRRTKRQVAPDLPDRIEQTLWCELSPGERARYDELREYFRASVAGWLAEKGLDRSRIHILEALLRLRQASCHHGLVDPARAGESSAKVEALVESLQAVVAEGHKALVFSQFTSFLALVRPRIEELGIPYEYLDGQTTDRAARVERFQKDEACPLFLISLKAGGSGLNLTAASYVYLLDPWWNPAVEAQAIDRAHRIGQDRSVIAYRLIARGTIEEKIVALQAKKRDLADALFAEDASLLSRLTAEDLQDLFA